MISTHLYAAGGSAPVVNPKLTFNGCESFERATFRSGVFEGTMARGYAMLRPMNANVPASGFPYLMVQYRIDHDRSGTIGAYFTTDAEKELSDSKRATVRFSAKSNEWNVAVIPLKQSPKYSGIIRSIRVDIRGEKGDGVKVGGCFLSGDVADAEAILQQAKTLASGAAPAAPSYTVKTYDGGEGEARSIADTVEVAKRNAVGMVNVQFKVPYTVRADANYVIRCEYQSSNAFQNSILMIRATQQADATPTAGFGKILGGDHWIWANYSSIRNTPAGRWDHRYSTFRARHDSDALYVNVLVWGNPLTARIRNVEVFEYPEPTIPIPPLEAFKDAATQEQMLEILEKREPSEASVGEYKGRKVILVNDSVAQGIGIYKGYRKAGTYRGLDVAHFGELGVNLVTSKVLTGKPTSDAPEGFWTGPQQYDFKRIDDIVYETLRLNPSANIILELVVSPYQMWYKHHPESELARNGKGELAYGPGLYKGFTSDRSVVEREGSGRHWIPSWSSGAYLRDVEAMIADTVAHLKKQPYAKAIVGAHFSGGDDGQFGNAFYDHSDVSRQKFQEFLAAKYPSIEKLNAIWGSTFGSFQDIGIPDMFKENWKVSHQTVELATDYRDFSITQTHVFRDRMAKAFKESFDKPVIAISYGFPSGDYFANLKWIDAFCFQPGYFQRKAGVATNNFPRTLFHRPDKLFITEFDTRGNGDLNVGSAGALFYNEGVGWEASMEDWRNSYRKLIGQLITRGYYYWYYDMYQYYNSPEFRQEIGKVQNTVEKIFERGKTPFKPDVCVVMSHRQVQFSTNWLLMTEHINYNPQYQEFELSGVPMDKVYLSEMRKDPRLKDYKVFIFFQNGYISDADRLFIEEELKRDGRTLIWIYDSGFIGEAGISLDRMKELVGMEITHESRTTRLTPLMERTDPLLQNVPELFSGTLWLCTIRPNLSGWEPFRISDPGVKVLGRYQEDGTVAAAMKEFPEWTSIYLASPQSLHGQLLHNIAKAAGCYVAGDYGEQLDIDSGFASIHGVIDNPKYRLTLPPGKSTIRDAFTGEVLGEQIRQYEFPVEAWKTYWFLFE